MSLEYAVMTVTGVTIATTATAAHLRNHRNVSEPAKAARTDAASASGGPGASTWSKPNAAKNANSGGLARVVPDADTPVTVPLQRLTGSLGHGATQGCVHGQPQHVRVSRSRLPVC